MSANLKPASTVFMTSVLLLVSVKLFLRNLEKDLVVDQRAEVKLGYEDNLKTSVGLAMNLIYNLTKSFTYS